MVLPLESHTLTWLPGLFTYSVASQGDPWISTHLFSPGPCPVGVLKAISGETKAWSPKAQWLCDLIFYFFFFSPLLMSSTFPSLQQPKLSSVSPDFTCLNNVSLFVNLRSNSMCPLISSSNTYDMKVLLIDSWNLLDCFCLSVLSLHQNSCWLWPLRRTRACDCETSSCCPEKISSTSFWLGGLQQISAISSLLLCLPVLTHKVSADSSPMPRQSSMHSCCCLT